MTVAQTPSGVLERVSDARVMDLLPEWESLWARSISRSLFSHPRWWVSYRSAFEPAADVFLLSVRIGGRLAAITPLIRDVGLRDGMPVRMFRAPMNPHCYRVELLGDGQDPAGVAGAMVDALAAHGGWDVLSIPKFPRGGLEDTLAAAAQARGLHPLSRPDRPTRYIPLPDAGAPAGDAPWLATAGSSLKRNMRRSLRQLEEDFKTPLSLERVETADPAQLNRFYEIEGSGWKGREGTAIRCSPETRRFYDGVAAAFAETGSFVLHFLRAGDRTLAGGYSVVAGDCIFGLKWSYDEAYAKYRAGRLLTAEMLRDSWERGLRSLDMGPDADYKREWTPHVQEHGSLYLFNRTAYGALLHAYRGRLRPWLGQLVRRRPAAEAAEDDSRDTGPDPRPARPPRRG